MADLYYEYDMDDINEVVDEQPGSNNFIGFRKIRWNPDADFRYDIRKYFTRSDGVEVPGKGISFMTESGPDSLAEILVANGFGNTEKLVDFMTAREDFSASLAASTHHIRDKFMSTLKKSYEQVEKDGSNKAVNAKEMLDGLF